MLVYNIGISAIRANQVELQTISNNIANANTEGYHRQRVNLAEANPVNVGGFQFGAGVTVSSVQRLRSALFDNSLTLNRSQSSAAQTSLEALQTIETLFTPGTGSLHARVTEFFNKVEQLAAQPTEEILRREVISAADAVGREITSLNTNLDRAKNQAASDLTAAVVRVNELTGQISQLNAQIRTVRTSGTEPLTMLDQRDQLINELAGLVDVSPASLADEQSPLIAAAGWLVIAEQPPQLSVSRADDGTLQIFSGAGQGPVIPVGGKIAGLLQAHNETLPAVQDSLREWTSALVSGVDTVQATGLGLNGPSASFVSSRSVSNAAIPLAQASALFPVTDGELYVSVTSTATGVRQTHRIAIDVSSDSLNDVLADIDALAGVSASLNPATGKVRIAGDAGFAVDFAGRPSSTIDAAGITGTARPQAGGLFTGSANSTWTASVVGSGEVGVTSGLKLRVTDSATGDLLAEVNIGSGYQANQPLAIAQGLTVSLGPGTLAAGDTFSLQAIADSDSTGILTTLGLGGLFNTPDLRSVSVREEFLRQPELLAASRTGSPGDASHLSRLLELRDARLLGSGTETIEERLGTLTGTIGLAVTSRQAEAEQLQSQYEQLRSQQDAVSGVDPNEELLLMLEVQRSFQANARFLASVTETLDELLNLL